MHDLGVLAHDLVAHERATTAAFELARAEDGYARWSRDQRIHALEERTVRVLWAEVLHLLDGLRSLLHDDEFWLSLQVQTASDDKETQLRALQDLGRADLATMFELVGYTVPPPPPATELIDAAKTALRALQADQLSDAQLASAVQRAQADLTVLLWRAQRQIDVADRTADPEEQSEGVRTAARTVLRGTRAVLPVVAGAAVGAAVGGPAGAIAGAAAGKLGEKLLESGIDALLGSALLIGTHAQDPPPEMRAATGVDSIAVHLLRLRSLQGEVWTPAGADEANQHIRRLADLLEARGNHAGRYLLDFLLTVGSDEGHGRRDLQEAIDAAQGMTSGNVHVWLANHRNRRMREENHGRDR